MDEPGQVARPTIAIDAVERDTGLSEDTLRTWERRYGFPQPLRDANGARAYPLDQVERLRRIRRLLDAGHRPGQVVMLALPALLDLERAGGALEAPPAPALDDGACRACLEALKAHDLDALRGRLRRELAALGLGRFVTELVAPLNAAVGEAWLHGRIEVHHEHACSEALQSLLRQTIAALPPAPAEARPRVLLSTLPGEPHGLGLLMAEALLALHGAACIPLGVQTPAWDLVRAAQAWHADIVALGFSGCTAPQPTLQALRELRARLPATTALWAGGSAPVLRRRRIDGVLALPSLDEIDPALQAWRARTATPP
ncbi:MAG: MerR family transcriptional regulator [Burkholderiales bacterium]|nr:MerR family transcriptional regulator [Burkholderiales bacterium]